MGCITGFLTILNVAAYILFDIYLWHATGTTFGWIGIIGIVGFVIAFMLSGAATLSVRDYFDNTDWDIWKTKIAWANGIAGIVMIVFTIIFYSQDICGMKEFMEVTVPAAGFDVF